MNGLRSARLTVIAAALLAALSPPAGASGPKQGSQVTRATPVTAGSRYLALGDSVTFGYQEPQVVPTPDYGNASSLLGYPEHLGAELHLRVANAACPGETSASLIDSAARSNGCENAYRKAFPLHVRYKGAQLAYAIAFLKSHRDVRLVTLMIGANDLFTGATLTSVAGNVRQILSAVRNKAHYGGQLAIVNYYSLNYASGSVNGQSIALNNTVDAAAKPFHVVIADEFGELEAGALRFGGSPCGAGLLTQLGKPGACGIHPSYAGQALLAEALEKVIRL